MTDTASELDPPAPAGVPPEAALMPLLMGGFVTQAISVVARFGVADVLAGGPRPVEDIAAEVGAKTLGLYRVLRVVADFGVLTELPGRRFALTAQGELLRSDHSPSLRGLATHFGSHFHRAAWSHLYESVVSGRPGFDLAHGEPQFDYYRTHPEEAAIFDGAMTSVASTIYATLEAYDFGRFGKVADIGGGNGAYLAGILAKNPGLRGILLDLPDVVERSGSVLQGAGVADRCEVIGGSFFDRVPGGADAYVLTAVIHDWDDERSVDILRNVRAAMPEHATVLLGEPVVPDGPEPSVAKLLDLETLVGTTGRQRTESEFRDLLDRSGLRLTRIIHSAGPDSLVEAVARR
ncbi:methyltransferase [Streptomyces sp. NPDC049099]|uniref:methyltransferase n=1 Tax=Streptomyces sp. NPDC049099 TaxID=3155768 RepID=UPI00342EFE78